VEWVKGTFSIRLVGLSHAIKTPRGVLASASVEVPVVNTASALPFPPGSLIGESFDNTATRWLPCSRSFALSQPIRLRRSGVHGRDFRPGAFDVPSSMAAEWGNAKLSVS
jgi:hypothetical protein